MWVRDEFLAGAGLAEQQYRRGGGGDLLRLFQDAPERRTLSQEGGRVHPRLSWSRAASRVHLTKVAHPWRPRPAVALTVFRGLHVTPRHSKPNAGSAPRAGP